MFPVSHLKYEDDCFLFAAYIGLLTYSLSHTFSLTLSISVSLSVSLPLSPSLRLNKLLPSNAPLSTLRIITASDYPVQCFQRGGRENVPTTDWREYIRPLSAVIRLGREGASTDHSSVLFDVDMHTGIIGEGRSNAHW